LISAATNDSDSKGQGVDQRRLELLRGYVRSAIRMARLLLDEVLDVRFENEEPEEYRELVGKAGGEMAMLLRLASRALPGAEDAEQILAVARDLAPLSRGPQIYRFLFLRPSRAPMHTLPHFCLVDLGLPDEKLDRVARLALQSSVAAANERVPYRMLDAAWTRHLAFGDAELNHAAIPLSPLGAGVDLLEASTNDAYAFTHALPYVTDFGRLPLPQGLDRERLLGIAEALAVKALDEDDLDLLSEVLMAPPIVRLGWTPTLSFAWDVLERVWEEYGFVPGPGVPPARENETNTQKVRRVLGTLYHTMFASGLCCATVIACASLPAAVERGAGEIEAPPGKGAAWKINWERSSSQMQESLNFLSLGFSLRRALDDLDLARVREVLQSAAESDLLEHPLFIQALEMLERVGES
jgi:hypothetical protein